MLTLLPPDAEFSLPVDVRLPGATGTVECTLTVLWLPTDRWQALQGEGDQAIFAAIVRGWEGIEAHTGEPLPYSETHRDLLSQVGYFCRRRRQRLPALAAGAAWKKLAHVARAVVAPDGGREPCQVLRCNWRAARLFAAAQSQWRVAPSGHVTGLDYAGVRAAAEGLGIDWSAEFHRLQTLEDEALRALSQRRPADS